MAKDRSIPNWLHGYLTKPDLEQVRDAIMDAERKTSGEIVAMVVRKSSTVGHVPILVFTTAWLTCEIFQVAELIAPNMGHWAWELVHALFALAFSALVSRLSSVQRWLITTDDRITQVNMRAEVEFYEADLTATQESTGVLIFVSLMEHRVTVLADKGIAMKLPHSTWDGVVGEVVAGIKRNDLAGGLKSGIKICGAVLKEHFPRLEGRIDELQNHLMIKE